MQTTFLPRTQSRERAIFSALKKRFPGIWHAIQNQPSWEHTSVVVPSLSMDQEELSKVQGASFYEERLLFTLIRLRQPRSRLIYVTSQPVHPDIVDYYLQLLPGVPSGHARQRLLLLSVFDSSPKALTQKILERPRVLDRLRRWIGDPRRAYLTCYNSTPLERQLAVELRIPLNGVDPDLLWLGTKSGSRKVFTEAEVEHPLGFEDIENEDELIDAVTRLTTARPGLRTAVVKLNEGFSGEGNGILTLPERMPSESEARRNAVRDALMGSIKWSAPKENYPSFLRKLGQMRGVVEEFVEGVEVRSPSAQMRVQPDGRAVLISTHDQILGGSTGQVYLGCTFPADGEYRTLIQERAARIGEVLSRYGVMSRFGIDFLVTRSPGQPWQAHAIEINLRMGGTTPPFMALEFLTGGHLDFESGHFLIPPTGRRKYYYATDNLKSPAYVGLLPEDFLEILTLHGLHFRHSTDTGVLFYMIGALSQFGKVGVTCIGDSREEAKALYDQAVQVLDRETGADRHLPGHMEPLLDAVLSPME